MAVERYQKEDASGFYQLEDGSGVLLIESSSEDEEASQSTTHIAPIFHSALGMGGRR